MQYTANITSFKSHDEMLNLSGIATSKVKSICKTQ